MNIADERIVSICLTADLISYFLSSNLRNIIYFMAQQPLKASYYEILALE
jgi:hypothetical protein